MWNGHDYTGVYKDPAIGETAYRIGASKQADKSWDFTLFCPFDDKAVTTSSARNIPKDRREIVCDKCSRHFPFDFPYFVASKAEW
jgi:peptide methionine sulfoxide reductase MsrB